MQTDPCWRRRFLFLMMIVALLIAGMSVLIIRVIVASRESYQQRQSLSSRIAPIVWEEVNVYTIHKKSMSLRWPRLSSFLETHFKTHSIEIVEPVPLEAMNVALLHKQGVITDQAYLSIEAHRIKSSRPEQGAMTLAALSLYLTNVYIWQKQDPSRYFLILEDDVVIPNDFDKRIQDILPNLPPDWDMIYLSCHLSPQKHADQPRPYHKNLIRIVSRVHGTGAILYHPRILPRLHEMLPIHLQIDHDLPDKLILSGRITAYAILNDQDLPIIHCDNNTYGSSTQS